MRQYWEIKTKYSDMALFFRLGDFYEMFGDDAIKFSSILEVVLTKRTGVPMCGVPYHSVNSYIRKLIKKGFRVAICEQLEASEDVKGIVKRGVTRVITPGMILEDTILDAKRNNFLMAFIFDEILSTLAFAVADISTGEFFTSQTRLEFFETEISKYNPGEFIVSEKYIENKYVTNLILRTKLPISGVSNIFFKFENAQKIIFEIFGNDSIKKFELLSKKIICVCGALLSYIKKMQPESINIFSNIEHIKNSDFMCLDTATIKNLELLNSLANGKFENSLLSVVDSTKTSMGARLIRQWLIKPLLDIIKIKNRQNMVKFFIKNSDIRKEITDQFKNISDIERIIARIFSNVASPRDLIALKNSLIAINNISNAIKSVNELNINISDNIQVINKISLCLFDEPSISLKDGNIIKNGISCELDELRKIVLDTKSCITKLETSERIQTKITNLKIGYTTIYGYYIEISKSNISLIPKHYIRKQTLTNGERYITEELKVLEGKISSAQIKILNIENNIFNDLKKDVSFFSTNILETSQIISEIDIFCGFAINALNYDYICPDILSSKELFIKSGRHPVVEKILKHGEFTANDIFLNEDSRIMILTGPNMSGKSTYLRQTALIVIMAQIGSFVPAYGASIGIVDKIFTRIGAGDNLAGGESTFMVEMIETANILNQYTERSLIIMDEVGRGTSTYDGISIAWAMIEFFANDKMKANIGVKVLFSTHYFELTVLSKVFKCVVNYKVDVREWNDEVIFLHKIIDGIADKSYGIYVAKIAGIPVSIIEKAYKILDKFEANQIS
ncbi:MAG: DNA mismatch repair protein MutS [Endomicrobium sp.]|jgi:DNA mismatch repair protein MutS|nr:DNA mismatch repair protein MutS [Endomicrobium sp.]